MLRILDSILERICNSTLLLSGIFIILMGFTTTYSVVMRYIFRMPSAAAYELTMMLLVLGTILALPSVERLRRNIRMDLLVNSLPRTPAVVITNLVGPVFGLFYCYILITRGWTEGMYSLSINETTGSAWDVPIYWLKIIIPILFALLFLVLIAHFVKGIAALMTQRAKTPVQVEKSYGQ